MGSIYGAVIGTVVVIVAQGYLREVLSAMGDFFGGWWMTGLFNPDRWLLWLGLLFVLCVYFFPQGIVGELRRITERRQVTRNNKAVGAHAER